MNKPRRRRPQQERYTRRLAKRQKEDKLEIINGRERKWERFRLASGNTKKKKNVYIYIYIYMQPVMPLGRRLIVLKCTPL